LSKKFHIFADLNGIHLNHRTFNTKWNEIESSQQKYHSRESGNLAVLSVFSGFLLAQERQPVRSITYLNIK